MKRLHLMAWAALASALMAMGCASSCGCRNRPILDRLAARFRQQECDPCCSGGTPTAGVIPNSVGASPLVGAPSLMSHGIGTPVGGTPSSCCGNGGGPTLDGPGLFQGAPHTPSPVTPGTTIPPGAFIQPNQLPPGAFIVPGTTTTVPGTTVPPATGGETQPLPPRLIPEAQPTPATPSSRTKEKK